MYLPVFINRLFNIFQEDAIMMPAKKTQNWLPGIFNDFLGNEWIAKANSSAPALNIIETDKEYKVEVAAPGLTKDDFTVKIDDNDHLIISVEKKEENEEKDKKGRFLRRDFSYSQFQQTLILPDNVDKAAISAKQENGVLCIEIPKKETPETKESKNIEVK